MIYEVAAATTVNEVKITENDKNVPITSLDILNRGENLFVAAYANGQVKLYNAVGDLIIELSAHSRAVNALKCHPTKSLFVTVSDDTFCNLFEVIGDSLERVEVDVRNSTCVKDLMLVGVEFWGQDSSSILAVPYDYPTLILWEDFV